MIYLFIENWPKKQKCSKLDWFDSKAFFLVCYLVYMFVYMVYCMMSRSEAEDIIGSENLVKHWKFFLGVYILEIAVKTLVECYVFPGKYYRCMVFE